MKKSKFKRNVVMVILAIIFLCSMLFIIVDAATADYVDSYCHDGKENIITDTFGQCQEKNYSEFSALMLLLAIFAFLYFMKMLFEVPGWW